VGGVDSRSGDAAIGRLSASAGRITTATVCFAVSRSPCLVPLLKGAGERYAFLSAVAILVMPRESVAIRSPADLGGRMDASGV
jgi:hypothetical protein